MKPILIVFFLACSFQIFSQKSSRDNSTGNWTDNSIWTDNSAPPVTNIASNCTIYGTVRRVGNLDFGNGDLIVNDTLIILGNIVLGNNANISINPSGVLLVYGDYTSGNDVIAISGGILVVTGNFTLNGAANQGSFDITGGSVFIFDPTPTLKTGTAFTDLACPDTSNYPLNCGYGNETDLTTNPISTIFSSSGYTLSASGPTTFCLGGSVTLSIQNEAGNSNYQWYKDGAVISGATSNSYTTSVSGSYYLKFVVAGRNITTNTLTSIVNTIPSITGTTPASVCGTGTVTLGATASAGTLNWYDVSTGGSSLGTGTPFTTGSISASTVYYVDATVPGCVPSARTAVNATVISLPATPTISASGALTICQGNSVTLSSSVESGYLWSTAETTPDIVVLTSGNYTVQVSNAAGCLSAASAVTVVTVNPLPDPVVSGLTEVCEGTTEDYSVTLVPGNDYSWSVVGGTISGPSDSNTVMVNWIVAGTGTVSVMETMAGTGCQKTTPLYNVTKYPIPVLQDIDSDNLLTRR